MQWKIKDLIVGHAKVLEIGIYLCMRARQIIIIVSNDGWQSFHVCTVHVHTYKYVIGESEDVSDRPPSTPGGGFLSYLNSPVCACCP